MYPFPTQVIVPVAALRLRNTSVVVSHTFHGCHADFLPLPTNAETLSQPEQAWKNGNSFERGPSDLQASWIWIILQFWSFPTASHNASIFKSGYTAIGRMTTSVSELTIVIVRFPVNEACFAWRSIRLSASLWLHGASIFFIYTCIHGSCSS